MKRVVLLGASYLFKPLIEKLSASGEQYSYTMFPYKDCLPYVQKNIPSALENESNVEKLYSFDEAFCKKYDVSVLMETVITRINFKRKRISTENKTNYDYDVMVIADVPDNYLPDVKGTSKTGVYSVQKLFDVVNIKHATIFCDTVVISTDRLFGLDMARSLLASRKDTLCILPTNFILKRLLSDAAYAKVIAWLQNKGLQVFADASVTEILGDADAKAVRIDTGKVVAGDLIVFDSGKENYRLFKGTDLNVNGKISINTSYKTELDDVYAADRVIEDPDGLSEPFSSEDLYDQATTIASAILGQNATYEDKPSAYQWNWDDLSVAIIGQCFDATSAWEDSFDESNGAYRRTYRKDNRLIGAVLLNCPQDVNEYQQKIGADYVPLEKPPVQDTQELASIASKTLEALSQLEKNTGDIG